MPGHRCEEHAARREDAVQRRERGADVVDELERLRDDRAVERVARDLRRVGEVADDRRLRVSLGRHQDVRPLDAVSEARRVVGRRDLEDAAADVGRMGADERLDVDAVDRRAALEAPVRVDRRHAAEVAERRWTAPTPVDVGRAERAEPATDGCGTSGAGSGAPSGQGRDHRRRDACHGSGRSSSSRRTRTTASFRSVRRWHAGSRRRDASSS